jgi:hypothetical protein
VENGWHSSSVNIRLLKEKVKFTSEEAAPEMEISGIYHHSLTDIITVISHTFMLLIQSSGYQILSDLIHRSVLDPL